MTFLSIPESSSYIVYISSAMSMRRCFCSKFSNFRKSLPKISVKIVWHEPNDMPTSSATALIVILQWFIIIYFTVSLFFGCWRTLVTRTSVVINIFSAFVKQVIPELHMCSAHSRIVKRHSQHLKCASTFNSIFYRKLNTISWIHV